MRDQAKCRLKMKVYASATAISPAFTGEYLLVEIEVVQKLIRSFALLAYASSWLKCHEPEAFSSALIEQPADGVPQRLAADPGTADGEIHRVVFRRRRYDRIRESGEEVLADGVRRAFC